MMEPSFTLFTFLPVPQDKACEFTCVHSWESRFKAFSHSSVTQFNCLLNSGVICCQTTADDSRLVWNELFCSWVKGLRSGEWIVNLLEHLFFQYTVSCVGVSMPNLSTMWQCCHMQWFILWWLSEADGGRSHCQLALPRCTQVTKDFPLRISLHLCPWAKLVLSVVSPASSVHRLHTQSQAETLEVNGTIIWQ